MTAFNTALDARKAFDELYVSNNDDGDSEDEHEESHLFTTESDTKKTKTMQNCSEGKVLKFAYFFIKIPLYNSVKYKKPGNHPTQ